ncbi:CoA transferase [Citricoccus sp. NR2]|uniref:CoA transferase n=1 Tax=Citricoccus sp. NR2 TaxID=3004095 RepID=UPI0022DCEAC0|nr:CoA transferase [Citricoccus sp. NR2]WBL17895.1 CoA transferase [Citricoccus sp. NR2]
MEELFDQWTRRLSGVADEDLPHAAPLDGPRFWWGGALDVEGLALGATRLAATALHRLTGRTFSATSAGVAASFASLEQLRVDGRSPQGFAPLSGFHRTADGWVRLHANYPHHRAALERFLDTSDETQMTERLASFTADEIEIGLDSHGGVAAVVRSTDDWNRTAMGTAAAAGPWIRFTDEEQHGAWRPSTWRPPAAGESEAPLGGLRVLNLTRVIAGPSAARLLGALGADVIRVDPPHCPEDLEQHVDTGFCQRSVLLDLRDRSEHERLRELVRSCDVVLLGYRPGALESLRWSTMSLLSLRPEIRVVSLSAWGREGPWRHRRGFDSIVQAATGIADHYRDDAGNPGRLPVQALDHATGMGMVAAVALLLGSSSHATAELSLARTAHELLSLPAPNPHHPLASLEVPSRTMTSTPYGELSYIPPPLYCDGLAMDYSRPPMRYGTSEARWR